MKHAFYVLLNCFTLLRQACKQNISKLDWCFTLKPDFQGVHKTKYRWFNKYLCQFMEKLSEEYTPSLSKAKDTGIEYSNFIIT